ncbi:pseudouridylate synthase [Coprinopsis sp. MPI-PUGE-AT-0042]|nr:pseudouridylate synthase [Coprinopsis sp. MPI-PUGE-AT-0042]
MAEKRDAEGIDLAVEPETKRLKTGSGPQDAMEGVEQSSAEESTSMIQVDAEGRSRNEEVQAEESGSSKKKTKSRNPPPGKGKGRRERRSATKEEEEANREKKRLMAEQGIEPPPRLPKRQSALLIGFCGSGYKGMQIQKDGTKTIEGVLFDALVKVGAVSQDNADNPTKVALARAARTDAGVHAAGNVVSLKMISQIPGIPDLVAAVNEQLPPEIRFWGFVRTQNSFNARLRKYTYFFPSYLLVPPKPDSGLATRLNAYNESCGEPTIPSHPFWQDLPEPVTKEEELARKRAWRVNPEPLERLRAAASKYEATHNFHNFTVGREFKDRSNFRFMKTITVEDPVVYGETEWIAVLFHGQSFMLHQLTGFQRKMMAGLVLTCRNGAPPEVLDELFKEPNVFIPKMPSLGLLLEEPLFGQYNGRMEKINEKLSPDDPEYRPPIDFDLYRDKIVDFKEKFIYKNMRQIEDQNGLFDAWMRHVDMYAGDDLLYLNRQGKVPEESVWKKGERRRNAFREKRVFDITSFQESEKVKKQLEEDDASEEEEEVIDKKMLAETEG